MSGPKFGVAKLSSIKALAKSVALWYQLRTFQRRIPPTTEQRPDWYPSQNFVLQGEHLDPVADGLVSNAYNEANGNTTGYAEKTARIFQMLHPNNGKEIRLTPTKLESLLQKDH